MAKIKLSQEQRDALEESDQALVDAREALNKLKEMGIDVQELEDKLTAAEKLRRGLLDAF